MLSTTGNVAESVQICPRLPKSAQKQLTWGTWNTTKIWDFDVCQKTKSLRVEEAPMHVLVVWIFNTVVLEKSFLLSKNNLCLWISAYLIVENIFFHNIPHLLLIRNFIDMYLTHLGTRKKCCTIHAYLNKLSFWPPKL